MRIREIPPVLPNSAPPPARPPRRAAQSGKLPQALSVGLTPAIRKALDHPARRTILRGLLRTAGGSVQTAAELLPDSSPAQRSYHAQVLCSCRVIEAVGGHADLPRGQLGFRSLTGNDMTIHCILGAMERWDAATG